MRIQMRELKKWCKHFKYCNDKVFCCYILKAENDMLRMHISLYHIRVYILLLLKYINHIGTHI